MEKLAHILQEYPELAVFLTLALGFIFGHIKINTFKIGVVLGTLIVGGGNRSIGYHSSFDSKSHFF